MLEGFFKLQATATDILQVVAEKSNVGFHVHSGSGFFYFLAADENFACQDQCLCPLSRSGQSAFEQELVESDFQFVSIEFLLLSKSTYHQSASNQVSARCRSVSA